MTSGNPDYTKLTRVEGLYGTTLKTLAVDSSGRLYTLMVGQNGVVVAVDEDGNISSVMQGTYGSSLKTLLTDEDGRLLAQLMGMYGTTAVPISCDASGRLTIVGLDQTNINGDTNEGATWDPSIGTLLNNLNRIRYAIATLAGETWGTFTTSTATLWAKFNATTGHKHTAAANDGPQLDHGQLGGLTDDDHAQYLLANGSRAMTGVGLVRDVLNSWNGMMGGTGISDGSGAQFRVTGKAYDNYGRIYLQVPNAAFDNVVNVCYMQGGTDTPVLNLATRKIVSLADPTAAQDAATKSYVDTAAVAKSGFIILWSGSIATIPSGWVLCNGASSTPDLRDRFVVGAGSTYAVGATGGEATHALSVAELPAHHHNYGRALDAGTGTAKAASAGTTYNTNTDDTGSGTAHENRPPYYALAYIMKT
jgi:hypothetical protein